MCYYVYIYLNKLKPGKFKYNDLCFDYEPFYVGKGKGNRYLYHLNKVKNECKYKDSLKFEIIKENILNKTEPIILKVSENLTEDDSLFLEKSIISKIGRLDIITGPLTNINDGGNKPQDNYHHDFESKMKISISGRKRKPENRYDIVSPNGIIYQNVKLLNFCKLHNLDYQKIRKSSNNGVIKKIRITSIRQSKEETLNCVGWEVINKKISKNIQRKIKYKLIDPNGSEIIIYSGDIIKDRCTEFELDQRTLKYYKNKGKIIIKNTSQCSKESINCIGWEFIDFLNHHQGL